MEPLIWNPPHPLVESLFSVLPDSLEEILLQAKQDNQSALYDFIAIFNQRLFEISQKVFTKTQSAEYESYQEFKQLLMDVSGCYQTKYLGYAGFFSSSVRCVIHLKLFLEHYFDLAFSIREFQELWQTRTRNNHLGYLGISSRVGRRMCSHSQYFCVVIGPLKYLEYLSLLSDKPRLAAIYDCVSAYVGTSYHFNVVLTLPYNEVPSCYLAKSASTILGISTWLRATPHVNAHQPLLTIRLSHYACGVSQ